MIVRQRPALFQLFFIWRGSIVPHVLPEIVFVASFAALITWAAQHYGNLFPDYSAAPFALLGLAFSIFLGFRNNACYDRWWEARKQWGSLIVELRSLARETLVLEGDGDGDGAGNALRRQVVRRGLAFAHALAARLRGRDALAEAAPFLPAGEAESLAGSRNLPDALLLRQGRDLAEALRAGHLSDILYQGLSQRLLALSGVQAACERIRHTPLPFAYTLLLHRTAHLFCLLLPFGLARSVGWATPLLTAVLAYTFFGLDALGDELEEPFGTLENDLPLDALVRVLEVDLGEALGETELPPALEPQGYILL
ncbi:MAG TPA: bestrophin family protein [Azospira sp.]|nr:bestrophin family protein [Azospira sp.]